jgi:methylmalonyl-CoA mutase cobalamin-binding subunit
MTRVLVAGDVVLARALRDAGAEVIFVDGSPDQLATMAVQEDVDAIAVPREHHDAVATALAAGDATEIVLVVLGEITAEGLLQHVR